jgi:hypothetical protein
MCRHGKGGDNYSLIFRAMCVREEERCKKIYLSEHLGGWVELGGLLCFLDHFPNANSGRGKGQIQVWERGEEIRRRAAV